MMYAVKQIHTVKGLVPIGGQLGSHGHPWEALAAHGKPSLIVLLCNGFQGT